jgi:Ala-tRNA(Pro) deacylase
MQSPAASEKITTREAFLAWLEALGIAHETREHEALHTVEEARAARAAWGKPWTQGGHCKNLFLKDKKGALFLVVTLEERALKLNRLGKPLGAARLSFANAELLWDVLGVRPGSVTPFAAVNDRPPRVTVVLDAPMLAHERLHYHPLDNRATTAISRDGLLVMLRATGHEPIILDLVEAAGQAEPDDGG